MIFIGFRGFYTSSHTWTHQGQKVGTVRGEKRYVINSYGEILDELDGGDRIVRRASIENYKKYYDYKVNKDLKLKLDGYVYFKPYRHTNTINEELELLTPELSLDERSFLFSVIPYVGYDNYLKLNNNKKVSTKDLMSITDMKKTKVFKVLKSLDDKCIVRKIKTAKNNLYVVNPWVFHKGLYIHKSLIAIFGDYKIRCKGNVPWKCDS